MESETQPGPLRIEVLESLGSGLFHSLAEAAEEGSKRFQALQQQGQGL